MSTATAEARETAGRQRTVSRGPSLLDAVRWELTKLGALMRTRITLALCLLAPILTVLVVKGQGRPPKDTIYGRYIHESGLAIPLLVLAYAAQWVLPLLTALVAGDIFASEDQRGTWKSVLTRSASRAQLFWAKTISALGFAVLALVVAAASTILSSVVIVGHDPLVGLTGQLIDAGEATRLVVVSWALALPPLIGFTCLAILLSVLTRNPAFGIAAPVFLGIVMQLVGSLGGMEAVRPLLLSTAFESWHGLLTEHRFYSPLTWGLVTSAGWSVVCLAVAFVVMRRRDITGD